MEPTLWVSSVALSGDSKRIFTGTWDGTTCIWDAASGEGTVPSDQRRHRQGLVGCHSRWSLRWFDKRPPVLVLSRCRHSRFRPPRPLPPPLLHSGSARQSLQRSATRAKVDIAKALPPKVQIVVPAASLEVKDSRLDIKAAPKSRRLPGDGASPAPRRPALPRTKRHRQARQSTAGQSRGELEYRPGSRQAHYQVLADTQLVQGVSSERKSRSATLVARAARSPAPALRAGNRHLRLQRQDAQARLCRGRRPLRRSKPTRTTARTCSRRSKSGWLADTQATRRGSWTGLLWMHANVKPGDYAVFYLRATARRTNSALVLLAGRGGNEEPGEHGRSVPTI